MMKPEKPIFSFSEHPVFKQWQKDGYPVRAKYIKKWSSDASKCEIVFDLDLKNLE